MTIGTATVGASIHYTTDGSTPSETAGLLYSAPITVSSTTTINAIAYAAGMTDSPISSATYTITPGASWYSTGGTWTNRKPITIAHSQVSGSVSLTNFPMLFSVTDPALSSLQNGGSVGEPDGSDILFTASDGVTKLNHELESYDPVSGLTIAWVQIPRLSPTTDTVIYIYFGNPTASNQQNASGVWDANYRGVWHLPNGTVLSTTDSTSNGNNGLNTAANASSGEIGGAAGFNGSSSVVEVDSIAQSLQTGDVTFSAWVNSSSAVSNGSGYETIMRLGDDPSSNDVILSFNQLDVQLLNNPAQGTPQSNDGALHLLVCTDVGCGQTASSQTSWSANTWYYVVGTYSATNGLQVYVNGSPAGSNSSLTSRGSIYGARAAFGAWSLSNGDTDYFSGMLDEVRMSSIARSPAWIATEYNNQNSPLTFVSVGNLQGQEQQAAAPVFSPTPGLYNSAITVTISTTTSDASIRYTTDGSTPSETAGTLYTGPFSVATNAIINAIAYETGMTDSPITSATYTIAPLVAAPAFTPASGTYTSSQTVLIGTATAGASIRYTTNGAAPGETTGTLYTGPITVSSNTTINAIAYETGMTDSPINSATYTISPPVAAPAFSPASGTYTSSQTVLIGTTTAGASIRYTTNGSAPSETAGTLYTGPITVSSNTTINAIAYETGMTDSPISSATYTIAPPVAAAIVSPTPGTYTTSQTVTMSTSTPGATIRYTTNGTTPTETVGTIYVAPITVSASTTINAIAYESGMTDSPVSTATYSIAPLAGTPSFNPAPGTYASSQSVTIGTTTVGASIRYTTDGSTPSETAGILYTVPITVSTNTIINAIAYASGLTDSAIGTAVYTINTPVASPIISPPGGTYNSAQTVAITSTTAGASIRYTTDGSTPSETAGVLYSAPITVSSSTTINAMAYEAGMTDSTVATANFTIIAPTITGVSPMSAAVGTSITITGTNFGATQGTSTVTFNGTTATPVSWSGTSIAVPVPVGAATGQLIVTVGGLASNAIVFTLPITYVQGNYVSPQASTTSVIVPFTAAQAAGDLNVVVVGWNDTAATVSSISDSSGNTYLLAIGPTAQGGVVSQSIYYAKNIAAAGAGLNTVTVTFSTPAAFPDIRVLEYNGADPNNPVDVTVGSSGNSGVSSSGSVNTTDATDLLFGANMVLTSTSGPGANFTTRLLTQPDGDVVEDEMVTAIGSYSATAPLTAPGAWIMQMVAFRTPSMGTLPTVTSVSPSNGPTGGGTVVTITGSNFAPGATVTFGGMAANNVVVVNGTTLTATTPAGSAGAAIVTVTVDGQSGGLAGGFAYVPPTITYIQGNYAVPHTTTSSVPTTYSAAQTAGDLNVVVVSSHDTTSKVSSVTDTSGNTYTLAVGPSIASGYGQQSIYYSANIAPAAAGANIVTVTFATPASIPDIRILEYSGANPTNPVDVTAANTGTSNASNSGVVSTTYAADLLFGANRVQDITIGPGSGFTERLLTTPNGDIAEDEMVSSIGNYSASAPLRASGAWIMQLVAFRALSTPPTAPSNLTATAVSANQITLSWTAAMTNGVVANYVVQRCQGAGCTNFAQIAAPAGTSYNDAGLLSNTSYTYQVQAVDTAGNTSAFSSPATATTQIPTPPTAPGSLSAAASGAGQINLSWIASASNVGLAGYSVQRCQGAGCANFAPIGTAVATSYNDTGLSPSTSYSYRLQAVDILGNASPFSNSASATTQATQPPAAPTNLTATAVSESQIDLSWTASTSNVGVAKYIVLRCQSAGCTTFVQVATPSATTYIDTGLSATTTYSYQVQAVDQAGNTSASSSVASATTGYLLPLKASSNNRYLVDQNGTPFLIMGDSPQSILGNISSTDMVTYLADRQRLGYNALWVNALCATYTYCDANGVSFGGIAPFTTGTNPSNYVLSTPNPAYFALVDNMLNVAASDNLVVFLEPIETGSWLATLRANGPTAAYNYGVYIGNRYKNFPNIVWLHGNDFQTWSSSSSDNNLAMQVMAGIASVDPNHLQTIELNYFSSYSNQDSILGPLLTVDSAYTYYETYDIVLQSYNSSPTIPTYLVEANYEYDNNTNALPGPAGPFVLREQAYWAMLSGAGGQIAGNHYTTSFPTGWQSFLDSPGSLEIQYINQLFATVPWWQLVPDTAHEVVTGGYGNYNASNENLTTANYCTTGWIPNGSVALTYCPTASTLTVNLKVFPGPVTAQWYDPSNGTYTAIPGSPFANTGAQVFASPGANHDGNLDWVLVLHP